MSVYKCNVEFSRYFVEGTLEGILTKNNKMGFLDWDDAKDWVRAVNHSKNVPIWRNAKKRPFMKMLMALMSE